MMPIQLSFLINLLILRKGRIPKNVFNSCWNVMKVVSLIGVKMTILKVKCRKRMFIHIRFWQRVTVSFIKLKDDSFSDVPLITVVSVCFKISSSLEVQVCHKNVCLATETFKWILQSGQQENLKCEKWTKFDNLVSQLCPEWFHSLDNSVGIIDKIINLVNVLKHTLKAGSILDDGVVALYSHVLQIQLLHLDLSFSCLTVCTCLSVSGITV